MSLHEYRRASLKDKIREQALKEEVKVEKKEVKKETVKGRRLNK